MSPTELLAEMRDHYDGFCFDGQTRVYNPFSTMQFFFHREFRNYWFASGTSSYVAQYLQDKRLTVEQFRGLTITSDFASEPGEIDTATLESYLYQSGYLSLRPGEAKNFYTLDYLDNPNLEVLRSMSRLLIRNFFGSEKFAAISYKNLAAAFRDRNPAGVVEQFSKLLPKSPMTITTRPIGRISRVTIPKPTMANTFFARAYNRL
jgi:hypothetical protein